MGLRAKNCLRSVPVTVTRPSALHPPHPTPPAFNIMCYDRASVWPFAVGVVGNDRETPSVPAIDRGTSHLWALWVVKLKCVFDFSLGYPKRPQNSGAKNVACGLWAVWAVWVAVFKSRQNTLIANRSHIPIYLITFHPKVIKLLPKTPNNS